MKPVLRPLSALIPSAAAFFEEVVTPAIYGANANQADRGRVLGAFILVHALHDWAAEEGLRPADVFDLCPFARIIAEIATASKHAKVDRGTAPRDPHCLEFREVDYGQGAYGKGAYGRSLQVKGRRHKDQPVEWFSLAEILKDAAVWWERQLGLAHTPRP